MRLAGVFIFLNAVLSDTLDAPADFTILQRYQRRRMGNNLGMMWLMEGFKRLFAQQDLGIRWMRNIGMNAADKMTPIKNQMIRKAMGLDS